RLAPRLAMGASSAVCATTEARAPTRCLDAKRRAPGSAHRLGGDGESDPAHFQNLFERNRRRAPRANRTSERGYTGLLTLVRAPEPHAAEAFPAEGAEHPEVVELQNATVTEDFDALLRKRAVTVREIVDRADRAIRERQRDACLVGGQRRLRPTAHPHHLPAL